MNAQSIYKLCTFRPNEAYAQPVIVCNVAIGIMFAYKEHDEFNFAHSNMFSIIC